MCCGQEYIISTSSVTVNMMVLDVSGLNILAAATTAQLQVKMLVVHSEDVAKPAYLEVFNRNITYSPCVLLISVMYNFANRPRTNSKYHFIILKTAAMFVGSGGNVFGYYYELIRKNKQAYNLCIGLHRSFWSKRVHAIVYL